MVPVRLGTRSGRLLQDRGSGGSVRVSWKGRRRFHTSHIVASSPAEEEAAAARAHPLRKEDLVAFLQSGCKPKAEWRIGTEHEKLGFKLDTLEPMTFAQITLLLDGMASRFGYERVLEGDIVIGLQKVSHSHQHYISTLQKSLDC
jgi:glutamate--cysteine ligase